MREQQTNGCDRVVIRSHSLVTNIFLVVDGGNGIAILEQLINIIIILYVV